MSAEHSAPEGAARPLAKVEHLKRASDYLRGSVGQTLAEDTPHFSHDEYQLLKFHGVYQQDDRDQRARARQSGDDKSWMMMVRAKIPGGRLTAAQYLAFDDLADAYANSTLRLTTRQCIQLHRVSKCDLRPTIRALNDALVTTLGACGDVERNLMACPAPSRLAALAEVQHYARLLSDHTLPQTRAYHEIWLNGEAVASSREPDVEPLYGAGYLPRKFKSGLAIEGDNCIDVYSQDVGMVAHLDDGRLVGFTILVGGGLGKSHTKPDTHPAVAQPLCFVAPDDLLPTFLEIIRVQRDHGERGDRHFARMKYLVERWGVARFRAELQARLGRELAPPRPLRWDQTGDHLGWHAQPDGKACLGVWVENGRVQDAGGVRRRAAFHALVARWQPTVYLTAQQNILFADLPAATRPAVEALLRDHGVPLADDVAGALRYSMACPALPTCGLALAEAERALPPVVRALQTELDALGLADERLSVRMTGCPNGCARPYLGDIGFVGRTTGQYQLYLGGDFEGTRLSQLVADLVPAADLVPRLRPVLAAFAAEGAVGEGFGDWCARAGLARLQALTAAPEPVAAGR